MESTRRRSNTMSTVDLIDLGLFGLGGEKCGSSGLVEDVEMYHSEELDNLFSSHPTVENILDVSLQQSGIVEETTVESEKSMLVSKFFMFSKCGGGSASKPPNLSCHS